MDNFLILYNHIKQFCISKKIDQYTVNALLDYFLYKENISFSSITSSKVKEEYLLEKMHIRFSEEKGNTNTSISHLSIKKEDTNTYSALTKIKDNLVFYVQNEDELDYIISIASQLNRSITILYDFDIQKNSFPKWIQSVKLDFNCPKNYENSFLENTFDELYCYYNAFISFLNIFQPAGVVVLANTCFQEKVLSGLSQNRQIPVVALAYNNDEYNLDSVLHLFSYDHYIYLELSDTYGDFRENVSVQIAQLINKYVPYPYFSTTKEPCLQIGCGKCPLEGWLNIDLFSSENITFMNAEKKYPFQDSSFQFVFSEHLFEHLTYHGGKNMLYETYRILKPQGVLRLTMPGLEFLINLYLEKDNKLYQKYIDWGISSFDPEIKKDFGDDKIPPMFIVNNFMRFFGHKMLYDKETISYLLKKVGFRNLFFPKIGESIHPVFKDIEQHGKMIPEWANNLESFVVEAQK